MEECERSIRKLLNKLSIANLLAAYEDLSRQSSSNSPVFLRAFMSCLKQLLDSDVRIIDFQLLCLAGLCSLLFEDFPVDHFEKYGFKGNVNLFRFCSFLYLIDYWNMESISDFLESFTDPIRIDNMINLFQICAWKMRKENPVLLLKMIDNTQVQRDGTSRSKFYDDIVDDIKSNNRTILKQFQSNDFDNIIQILCKSRLTQRECVTSQHGTKLSKINNKTRKILYNCLVQSTSVEDAFLKIVPFMSGPSFESDLWWLLTTLVSAEPVYNPFYARLAAQVIEKKYKVRKYFKLFLKKFPDEFKTLSFKSLVFVGRFFSDLMTISKHVNLYSLSHLCSSNALKTHVLVASTICNSPKGTIYEIDSRIDNNLELYLSKLSEKIQSGYLSSIPNIERFPERIRFIN